MHFHAEHGLFFERRRSLRAAGLSVALTVTVLLINTGAGSTTLSLIGIGAALLLLAFGRSKHRLEPVFAWTLALIALAMLAGIVLNADTSVIVEAGTRVLCGVIWVLWLGTQVDWSALRQLLIWVHVPQEIVVSLDRAITHGVLTQREWSQRRDAARLRLGAPRLPLAAWGPLLSEGALSAFTRLEQVEENAMLRSASSPPVDQKTPECIHLSNVELERGGQVILEKLELRIQQGEWLLLCGPSGAGKSSLLRLLAGLDRPASGSMTRIGTSLSSKSSLKDRLDGRVALLKQNPEHHFIASTVAEDITWGLLQRGVESNEANRRAKVVAEALRIGHLLARPCHQLSFGEQRRVALAGAMVLQPSLLLLDEPTAGLDPVSAHELRALVTSFMSRTKSTCVWATHDLHNLPPLAKRIVLLRERRLIFDGPVEEGLSRMWLVQAGLALPQEE